MARKAAAAKEASFAPPAPPAWPATQVEVWKLDKIKPYPNNARTHPPEQINLLAQLMLKRGVDQPIVVDEDGVILKGHGRLLAAQKAGLEEFPVAIHRGLSDIDKRAVRIEDNQVALLSGWDTELLRLELSDLKLEAYDMPLLGFGQSQLVQFMTNPLAPNVLPQLEGLKFAVIVECESETQQTMRLEQLTEMGFSCRALIS